MSTYVKVKGLMNDLVKQNSFVNVLDIPMVNDLDISPELASQVNNWFDLINTGRFCNTFIALNPEYANKFTTVEREFRRVRETMRNVNANGVNVRRIA